MVSTPPSQAAPATALQFFSDSLSLSAGAFPVASGERIVGPMRRGLKIAVLLDGLQSLALDNRPALTIEGPAVLIAANEGEHVQQRTGIVGGSLRCAILQLELDFVEQEFAVPMRRLFALAGPGGAGAWVRPAGAVLRGLARQMAECPVAESLRPIYLGGKALELTAHALDELLGAPGQRARRLPERTREQVHLVRDMLLASMHAPPSLAELARASGLNPTKLTSAFRSEFGSSVFGYLQEQRLQHAHALIAGGEASVAEAAFRVGYTPAHFSGLFRRRFGLPPSALR
ncbi:helix-turn-helix transcriptional regulator [Bosea minatitlanensis]|uniref:Helix-turn-helix transcriptional regulator n=1 Tax=Bosea minatitlanensis TaxID=128782 RepID=A0ABW0F775_9HYPH|nr:AraC family transcriptional regulator [Bosea minatitlanensis]MCT4493934.1 AraC family transcriptional regulator [Bosea minatitlanensis]